jgi:predicted metal-dependent phosphoesterase TrpH
VGIDLHIHSTASDGKLSPEAVVGKAAELGLTIIALTDHDSVDGIPPALAAARAFPGLRVIPGVEISTEMPYGQIHVLGYFIDYTSKELKSALESFRSSRQIRARRMIAKLHDLGIDIDWQRVQEIAGDGSIGRPHIAQVMLEKDYITSFTEAFDKYIGQGGPAYVERDKMTPVEAVELIIKSKGLPVLAHPFTVTDPEAMVIELIAAGLIGIEAYYKDYSADEIRSLVSVAKKYNLVATGGSDYHGLDDASEVMLGGVDVPLESAERLIALADKQAQNPANQ